MCIYFQKYHIRERTNNMTKIKQMSQICIKNPIRSFVEGCNVGNCVRENFETGKIMASVNSGKTTDKMYIFYLLFSGTPYDYGSIMHYGLNYFSKNRRNTLQPLRSVPRNVEIGQRKYLSRYDIDAVNKYYCSGIPASQYKC